MPNFTVITRTPTPKPQPPTQIPTATKSDPGGGNPTAIPPTATQIPATATPTLIPVTLVPTPDGGFMPTAVACGFPPTAQAINTARVRSGPGTDYGIIGQLVYLETRPIVGRAADSEWWVIQFANNEIGWVANAVVTVHGNTSGIPIAEAPPINGEEPTPGPLWNPTPNPDCPDAPSATPSATPAPTETIVNTPESTPVNTETATVVPTETATPDNLDASAESAEDEEEAGPTTTATSVVPSGAETAAEQEETTAKPTAEPLDDEDIQNAASALPCAAAMIGLAVIGFLVFRRIF
ncbi:MAG: SH3 domain-containing protein [Aquificales bacterium]|nr:SH3 domain-containing protein [Aquificales bacterium]